jgi:hypothetical protein
MDAFFFLGQVLVTYTCNPSYLGDWELRLDWESACPGQPGK